MSQKKPAPIDTAKDEAAIRTLVTDVYSAKVNANDAASYANELFTSDVLWAPPDAPDSTNKPAIQSCIQNSFNKFVFAVQSTAQEIRIYGEFAYAIGIVNLKLTPKAGGDIMPHQFRVFWLLIKQANGSWLISRQIWNKKPLSE